MSLNNLGLIYIDKGQNKKAINLYEKLIKKDKESYNPLSNISSAYFNIGQYKTALKYINKYIEKVDDKEGYLSRAKTYFKLEKYKEAIEDCEVSIKANIDLQSSYYNLREYKNANKYYKEMLKLKDISEKNSDIANQKIEETNIYIYKNIDVNPLNENKNINKINKYKIGYFSRGIYVGTVLGLILRTKLDVSMSTKVIITSIIVSAILGFIVGCIKDKMCVSKMLVIRKIEKDPVKNEFLILAINKDNIQMEYIAPADTMRKGRFKVGDRIIQIKDGIYNLELK